MLDRTAQQDPFSLADNRRKTSDYLVAFAFFGTVGVAMVTWMAAIGWASWRLIEWMLL